MLEFTQTNIEIKFGDKVHQMRVPTYKESLEYRKSSEQAGDNEELVFESICSYFQKLGLPKDVTENLELDHLNQVMDFLLRKKK